MKGKRGCFLALLAILGACQPALAAEGIHQAQTRLEIAGKNAVVDTVGEIHVFDCRCIPQGRMMVSLPQDAPQGRLYFTVREKTSGTAAIVEETNDVGAAEDGVYYIEAGPGETKREVEFYLTKEEVGCTYGLYLLDGSDRPEGFALEEEACCVNEMFLQVLAKPLPQKADFTEAFEMVVIPGQAAVLRNGQMVSLSHAPYCTAEGVLMVPLREMVQVFPAAQKAEVQWQQDASRAILSWGSHAIIVETAPGAQTQGELRNGVLFVPLRSLFYPGQGVLVAWQADRRQAVISYAPPMENQ